MSDTQKYSNGAEFWRDTALRHGMDEAFGICGRYLGAQMQLAQPGDEHQFCRELFTEMFEATAGRANPGKLVYPYSLDTAESRLETSFFRASGEQNGECARAIDTAITASCYERNRYNLDLAAMKALHDFGFERVNMTLARNLQQSSHDRRFSQGNIDWAHGFSVPDGSLDGAILNAHPVLLDGFTSHVRKLYDDVGAERFALPGREERGEIVHGYEIVRAIEFNDNRGFVIGQSPAAPTPFVCWKYKDHMMDAIF